MNRTTLKIYAKVKTYTKFAIFITATLLAWYFALKAMATVFVPTSQIICGIDQCAYDILRAMGGF